MAKGSSRRSERKSKRRSFLASSEAVASSSAVVVASALEEPVAAAASEQDVLSATPLPPTVDPELEWAPTPMPTYAAERPLVFLDSDGSVGVEKVCLYRCTCCLAYLFTYGDNPLQAPECVCDAGSYFLSRPSSAPTDNIRAGLLYLDELDRKHQPLPAVLEALAAAVGARAVVLPWLKPSLFGFLAKGASWPPLKLIRPRRIMALEQWQSLLSPYGIRVRALSRLRLLLLVVLGHTTAASLPCGRTSNIRLREVLRAILEWPGCFLEFRWDPSAGAR